MNSQLESVPQPLMSADLRRRIAKPSTFGSHAAPRWLWGCDRFPAGPQLLSLSRSQGTSPARVKPCKMGQATALPRGTAELPGSCVSRAKPRAQSQSPANIPALEMSGMSLDGRRRLWTVIYVCFQVHVNFPSPI